MKIFFSVGEASGDVHGASVAKELLKQYPKAQLLGMGGDLMKAAGVDIRYDIKNLGYIGLVEIVKALPSFFKLRSFLRELLIKEKPDVFVCIDYPGFNMRMAKVAHDLHIPVVYYICPTIWAWHKSRGKDIAKYVDQVISIFPFEAKAYEEFGANVAYVGHPLVDIVQPKRSYEENMTRYKGDKDAFRVLLMPGSRKQEVLSLLDTMLKAAEELALVDSPIQFFLPRAHTIDRAALEVKVAAYHAPVTITEGDTYDVMQICHASLAASGTATLETALMGLPTILLYKVSPVTFFIGKRVVNLTHLGLPNIIAEREVIPELLQGDVTVGNVVAMLTKLRHDTAYYDKMKDDLNTVKTRLGEHGAVVRVAHIIGEVAMQEIGNGNL